MKAHIESGCPGQDVVKKVRLWYLLAPNPQLHLNTVLETSDQYSLKQSRSSDKKHPQHMRMHAHMHTCIHKDYIVTSYVQC